MKAAKRTRFIQEYYFSRKMKELNELKKNGIDIINLGIGNPDMMPHHSVLNALKMDSDEFGSNGYQAYNGLNELREAIADYYSRDYSVQLNPVHEIVPFMGSKEALTIIAQAFINPGDKVLVPNPGYPTYSSVTRFAGGEVVEYDLFASNGFQPDIERIKQTDTKDVKLMWLNYPNMPTGACPNLTVLSEIIKWAKSEQILIVNDNPYSRILQNDPFSIFQLEGAKDVAIELNTLSKSHNMAGFRFGWTIGNKELMDVLLKVKSNVDSGMYRPIQKAAITALNLRNDWFDQLNEVYSKRRNKAIEILESLGCHVDREQVGMFLWGKLKENTDVEEFVDELIYSKGIFITPGTVFGSNGREFIRISLCSSNQLLKTALKQIRKEETIEL